MSETETIAAGVLSMLKYVNERLLVLSHMEMCVEQRIRINELTKLLDNMKVGFK